MLSSERSTHRSIPSPHAGEVKGQQSTISALNTCRSVAIGILHQACEGNSCETMPLGRAVIAIAATDYLALPAAVTGRL